MCDRVVLCCVCHEAHGSWRHTSKQWLKLNPFSCILFMPSSFRIFKWEWALFACAFLFLFPIFSLFLILFFSFWLYLLLLLLVVFWIYIRYAVGFRCLVLAKKSMYAYIYIYVSVHTVFPHIDFQYMGYRHYKPKMGWLLCEKCHRMCAGWCLTESIAFYSCLAPFRFRFLLYIPILYGCSYIFFRQDVSYVYVSVCVRTAVFRFV